MQFTSPSGTAKPETNIEFGACYNDTGSSGPLSVLPYAKLVYAITGDSTLITGARGGTFDVELGAGPTLDLNALNVMFISFSRYQPGSLLVRRITAAAVAMSACSQPVSTPNIRSRSSPPAMAGGPSQAE